MSLFFINDVVLICPTGWTLQLFVLGLLGPQISKLEQLPWKQEAMSERIEIVKVDDDDDDDRHEEHNAPPRTTATDSCYLLRCNATETKCASPHLPPRIVVKP